MSFFLDPTKSADDNFFGIIQADNPKASHLKGRVTRSSPTYDAGTGLTSVLLESIPGQGYVEPMDVSYHRQRPVEASGTLYYGKVKLSAAVISQNDLIALIAAHFKVITSDVVIAGFGQDGAILYPRWKDENVANSGFTITPKEDSYLYHNGGQASFTGQFDNSFIRTDKQPAIAALAYPVAVRTEESAPTIKQRIATLLGLDVNKIALGANADDVIVKPTWVGTSVDSTIKVTTLDPTIAFAGATSANVPVRLPSVQLDNLSTYITSTGWTNDPTVGWYNNTTPWDTLAPFTGIPTQVMTALKRASGIFTCYYNTPPSNLGENVLQLTRTGESAILTGVIDSHSTTVEGLTTFDEGVPAIIVANVVDRLMSITFTSPKQITAIGFKSNYYETYARAIRGVKNLKFEFFVSE